VTPALSPFVLAPVSPVLAAGAILAVLGVGTLALAVASLVPATAHKARDLWPTLGTEVVIVAAGVVPFLISGIVLHAALGALLARLGYEAAHVAWTQARGARAGPAIAFGLCLTAAAVALVLWPSRLEELGLASLIAGGAGVALVCVLVARVLPRGRLRCTAELIAFPGVPAVLFAACALTPGYGGLVLLAFLLVETYDSYALLGGKLFGRRPAFPVLSPRKTVEGLAIGGLMLALTAALLGPLVFGWGLAASLLAALVISAAAVTGDLAASRLKRAAGVKDYPAVLPRQGGALDIVDAWLIAAPALVLVAEVAA